MITQTLANVQGFLIALHGSDFHTFQTFDDDSDRKLRTLARTIHGSYNEVREQLTNLNEQGAGVFVTINRTNGNGRKASDIEGLSALFVDFDGTEPDPVKLSILPEPSIVIQSKNGKHFYWLLTSGEPLEAFTPAQKQLINFLGSDNTIHDLSRVMRLPGFKHLKDANEPFEVSIIKFSETRYSIQDVTANIPQAEPAKLPAVLKAQVNKVLKAENGSRNDTLNRASFAVGKELNKGRISYDQAATTLLEAALEVGLSQAEAKDVIDRGLADGRDRGIIQDDDNLLLTKGLRNGNKMGKPYVASLRAVTLYPEMKFDILVGRWTLDNGQTFLSANKLAQKLSGDFWKQEDWLAFQVSTDSVHEALKTMEMDERYQYNSRLEYFDGLDWEETSEEAEAFLLDIFGLGALQLTNRFEALLFAKQMVGTVARVYKPGCPVQTMLVIQGDGNTGKSTLMETLSPRQLVDYVQMTGKDVLDPDQKRYIMQVEGRMMLVIDEVEQLTSTEDKREQLKQFIASPIDQGVRMHGTESEVTPRPYTLWATVNATNFLPVAADAAVKRRFFPVRTKATRKDRIANPWIAENRDLIWAAAKALYEAGWGWQLTEEQWLEHDKHIAQFCNGGDVEERILVWMKNRNEITRTFETGRRYLASELAEFIYGKGYKQYQSRAMSAWFKDSTARDLGWVTTKSKGNTYFTNICDTQSEAVSRIDVEREPEAEAEAETKPIMCPSQSAPAIDPMQPDRPF